MIENILGFWDVSALITFKECEAMALEGFDVRLENGLALIPVYDSQVTMLGEDAW